MKNINKIFTAMMLFSIIATVGGVLYVNNKVEKIVTVDVIKLFNEFKMKKDLEAKVDVQLQLYSVKIDSLSGMLKNAATNNDKNTYDLINKDLYQLQGEAQKAYEVSNKNINQQVWKRLNEMISEYGKVKGYRIIVGANGMGSVIYNDNSVDKTIDLINFVNGKYENGN